MADGRRNNKGTIGNKGGRKSKAEELRLRELGLNAIKEVYESEQAYWIDIAKKSKDSFPHLKMFTEYVYGKPKEIIENTNINYDAEGMTDEEIKRVRDKFLNDYS